MTPSEARAAFLWGLTTPQQVMAAASTPQLRRDAAERLGVSLRTVQRHAGERLPCPGPRCLTLVRGGGLCSWCRKIPLYGDLSDAGDGNPRTAGDVCRIAERRIRQPLRLIHELVEGATPTLLLLEVGRLLLGRSSSHANGIHDACTFVKWQTP